MKGLMHKACWLNKTEVVRSEKQMEIHYLVTTHEVHRCVIFSVSQLFFS
jgi:hypothetical protein